jgi:hypothetical protein
MSQIKITSTPLNSVPQLGISSATIAESATVKTIPFPGQKGDSGGFYEHSQSAVSTVWTINHYLGFNPNVTVMDSANTIVEAEIWYNNTNSLEIRFSHGISGKAYLS